MERLELVNINRKAVLGVNKQNLNTGFQPGLYREEQT